MLKAGAETAEASLIVSDNTEKRLLQSLWRVFSWTQACRSSSKISIELSCPCGSDSVLQEGTMCRDPSNE